MKTLLIAAATLLTPSIALAQTAGIEGTNYAVTAAGTDADSGNNSTLSGEVRFPIADYTGMTLNAGLNEFSGKGTYTDSSSKSGRIGIFIRKFDLGIISANYSYDTTQFTHGGHSIKDTEKYTTLHGAYYLSDLNLFLTRTMTRSDMGGAFNGSYAGIVYYITSDLSASASLGGMDADNTKEYVITYQPQMFGNAIGISASYQDTNNIDATMLSISYYFDTKVSLIDRNRKY